MSRRGCRLPPSAAARRARSSGFSLIELLIVITIIAIMIVVGVQVRDMTGPESALNATASEISSALADARSDAIVCGRIVWFEFSLGSTADARQHFRSIRETLPGREEQADEDAAVLTVREWREVSRDVRIESVAIGEQEPITGEIVSVPIRPDGTMPSFLVRLVAPELDPMNAKQDGWACIQVAGLLGQPRVLNRFVEPEFLREDAFK
jgi:prepilin-type N-terminal cleavage/methylation domain-containing protein